jgi:hypothetical protein
MVPLSMMFPGRKIVVNLYKRCLLITVLVISMAISAMAQVEKVALRTMRLGCGMCAVFSEIYLRQLGTIDKIQISKSQEAVMVTYKPGATFQPGDLRTALKKTEVGVSQIQIDAKGRLQEQGGKQFFVAGKDRFLLVGAPKSPKVPAGATVSVQGIVDDSSNPMQLRVMTVKPVQ